MTSVVPNIVEVLMNKNSIVNCIRANDWTAERAVIASNASNQFLVECKLTLEENMTFEFFTIGFSVRLSDRSLHREEQKNFIKNCPQWGWKPGPLDLQANALPTELGRNQLGRRFLKWALFVSCTTSHVGLCLFLESIEYDFIKAMKIQTGNWMLT